MDWKDIAETVGKAAPLLGTLLAGPAGGAVGGIIASALGTGADPQAVAEALANPDALARLREVESQRQVRLQELAAQQAAAQLQAATANAADINRTMQAEAVSERWPQYSWRPAIGFSVALAVALSVLTVFAAYGAAIAGRSEGIQHLPAILAAIAGIIAVVSPILGIASYWRGRAKASGGSSVATDG